jgi:hypothetical protein
MKTIHAYSDAEEQLTYLFTQLKMSGEGVSRKWLANVKAIRLSIAEMRNRFGPGLTDALVARLVEHLEGSARGAWFMSEQLIEIYDMINEIETGLAKLDSTVMALPVEEKKTLPKTYVVN